VRHYNGDRAASLRTSLLGAEAYQVRDFVERLANFSYRAAAVSYHNVENVDDVQKPLSIEYAFGAPNFARVRGKEILIDQALPPLQLGASLATLEVRETPLHISRELNIFFHAVLELPSGASFVAIPSALELDTEFGSYSLWFAEENGSICLHRELHLKAQRIWPQEYPRFVEFCRAVDTAERQEIKAAAGM
jgi:hypothetical protein